MEEIEEIIERYQKLNTEVKSMLTDYFNAWVGFDCMAYGKKWQREYFLTNSKLVENPYHMHFTHDKIMKRMQRSLKKKDNVFTEKDLEHMTKLEELVNYTNSQANKDNLTREVVHEVYTHLIPYLYGRKTKRELRRTKCQD